MVERAQFEQYVSDAIDNIPEELQGSVQNIAFKVEEFPSQEQRVKLGLRPYSALFGLYEGVPLTHRNGVKPVLPDVITVFMHPMIEMFLDEKTLKKQIFNTVWHEVAHYFGFNHEQIHATESRVNQDTDHHGHVEQE